MRTIGLTGGIGSGKSVVSAILRTLGIPVYDTDSRAKALYDEDPELRAELIRLFGQELYQGGILQRSLLASIIFSDTEALAQINALVHPAVRRDFALWRTHLEQAGHPICGIESAIMLSSILREMVDEVWVIVAEEEIRIQRAMRRDNVSRDLVLERLRRQMSQEEMISLGQRILYNNPDTPLLKQVLEALGEKF